MTRREVNLPLSNWGAATEMGAAAAAGLCLLLHCGLVLGQRVDQLGRVDHWNFLSRAGWYAQAHSLLCNTQGSHYYVARKIKVNSTCWIRNSTHQFEVSSIKWPQKELVRSEDSSTYWLVYVGQERDNAYYGDQQLESWSNPYTTQCNNRVRL